MRLVLSCVVLALAATSAGGAASARTAPPALPDGAFLVGSSGGLLMLAPDGRVPRTAGLYVSGAMSVAKNRRNAYLSVRHGDEEAPRLFQLDLATGARRLLARGVEPAVSPDGRLLAYLAAEVSPTTGSWETTGVGLRELATGTTRVIPTGGEPNSRTPGGPINWSPDGRTIAVFDGTRIRLVDVGGADDLASQPGVAGDEPNHPIPHRTYPPPDATTAAVVAVPAPPAPTRATSMTPVYLDANTVVAVYDCCIGYSHLVAFNVRTGQQTPFATLYGPPQAILRIGSGRLLVATAARLLVVATRGHTRVVARGVTAVAA